MPRAINRINTVPLLGNIKARIRRVGFLVGFPIFELGKKYQTIKDVGLNSNKRGDQIIFLKFYFELTSLQVFVLPGILRVPFGQKNSMVCFV